MHARVKIGDYALYLSKVNGVIREAHGFLAGFYIVNCHAKSNIIVD